MRMSDAAYRAGSDRRVIVTFPSHASLEGLTFAADIRALADEHARLFREWRRIRGELDGIRLARRQALGTDRSRSAAALRAGAKDPGYIDLRVVDRRAAALEREQDVVRAALAECVADLGRLLARNREAYSAELEEVLADDRSAAREALGAFRGALGRLAEHEGCLRWVGLPDKALRATLGRVAGLKTSAQGEAYSMLEVLSQLEAFLQEPTQRLPGIWRSPLEAPSATPRAVGF